MFLPALFLTKSSKSNEPDIEVMNTASLFLQGLEKELEFPLWTQEVLEQYASLKKLSSTAFIAFLGSNGFKVNENLSLGGFQRELSNGNKNPEELMTRAIALKSFLLHEILLLANFVREQKKLSLKEIASLVEKTTRLHIHMGIPKKSGEYDGTPTNRSSNLTQLIGKTASDTQQTLSPGETDTGPLTAWGITKRQEKLPPVPVSELHEQYFDKEKSVIEFLVLAYIFNSKEILTKIMHGYTQNPSHFDQHRPFTVYKSLDSGGE